MKQSTYKILLAATCGINSLAAAIGAIYFAMDEKPNASIALGLVAIFLLIVGRVNIHDAKIALRKESWRRGQEPSAPYLYSNLITEDAVAKGDQAGI